MGREDSGKSALISALMSYNDSIEPLTHKSSLSNTNGRVPSPSLSSTFSSSSSSQSSEPEVIIHEWSPFQHNNVGGTDETGVKRDDNLQTTIIQLWEEPSGTQLYQDANLIYMRPPCLSLIVLDTLRDVNHNTEILDLLNIVQTKCPGSYVIITLLQSSDSQNDDNKEVTKTLEEIRERVNEWLSDREQNIKREIQEIESDIQAAVASDVMNPSRQDEKESKPSVKELFSLCTGCLNRKQQQELHIHETIYSINLSARQGIKELLNVLTEKATNPELFPHLVYEYPDWIKDLANSVQELKDNGHTLIPAKDFIELIEQNFQEEEKSKEKCMEVCYQLEASGHVLLLQQPSFLKLNATEEQLYSFNEFAGNKDIKSQPLQYVCVNPAAFANMILNCLIADDTKTYKLEANRFWPKDSGFKPPDPDLLARVLEALQNEGCIREAILPILWQDYAFDQNQILYMSECLQTLGILMQYDKSVQDCAGLAMPHYSKLSAKTCHISVLMDKIPPNRPQLNWTSQPFSDDIQVTWKISSTTSLSSSAIMRCFAYLKSVFQSCCDYIYIWDKGVLIKFMDATICVEGEKDILNISGRVNMEDEETKEKAMQLLWIRLAPIVKASTDFMSYQMPGTVSQIKLSLFGSALFYDSPSETKPELSLVKCLISWQFGGRMTFLDGMKERQINLALLFPFKDKPVWTPIEWLNLVLQKANEFKLLPPSHVANESKVLKQKRPLLHKKSSRKNKGNEVKWKTEIENKKETLEDGPLTLSSSKEENPGKNVYSTDQEVQPQSTQDVKQISLTHEEWKKNALEMACQFVSCTMALAVADFVALKSEKMSGRNIEAQVTVARVTANAVQAVHKGDLEAAARAVVEAVQAVEITSQGKLSKFTSQSSQKSQLCSIL